MLSQQLLELQCYAHTRSTAGRHSAFRWCFPGTLYSTLTAKSKSSSTLPREFSCLPWEPQMAGPPLNLPKLLTVFFPTASCTEGRLTEHHHHSVRPTVGEFS